jgi:hypothetical protein
MSKINYFLSGLLFLFISLNIGYSMQWDILNHPENQSTISWKDNAKWISPGRVSGMFIINGNLVSDLYAFKQVNDQGEPAISRRWHLLITDLPQSAWFPNRSVQVTFYGQDGSIESVLDGSTFGEISVWESSPDTPDCFGSISLIVDFTKVRSQDHEFGIHVTIFHGGSNGPVIATPLG